MSAPSFTAGSPWRELLPNLDPRIHRALCECGETIGQVMMATEKELLSVPGFGNISLATLKERLAKLGLELGFTEGEVEDYFSFRQMLQRGDESLTDSEEWKALLRKYHLTTFYPRSRLKVNELAKLIASEERNLVDWLRRGDRLIQRGVNPWSRPKFRQAVRRMKELLGIWELARWTPFAGR